mmetsp:Transcript_118302/g.346569  ORF Transcript_118302/g.346569 Transcript_118302/m.346569 type:complete len:356 (+) Transcript_118302:132-1199(+)
MDVVVTSVAVMPSVHMSIGAAIASAALNMSIFFGFSAFTWFTWWGEDEDEENPEDEKVMPIPSYLRGPEYKNCLNLGVVGVAGSGKSSLINALRGMQPDDPDAAPVGVEVTTVEPKSYLLRLMKEEEGGDDFFLSSPEATAGALGARPAASRLLEGREVSVGPREVWIWDLPGLGSRKLEEYTQSLGLPFFDVVLIVFSQRLTGLELEMARSLEEIYKVPHLAVRSQVDLDVDSEEVDHGCTLKEVLDQLKADALSEGLGSVFLVSSRQPRKYELPQLMASIRHMAKARHRAHLETECPICYEGIGQEEDRTCCTCHWCGNAVCSRCARELRGLQGEAQCPFCRKWTSFPKPPIF